MTTSKNCTKVRATRAARLFLRFLQPIRSLFSGVADVVASSLLRLLHSDYDAGVGYFFELLTWRNLNHLHGIDEVTVVYKSLNGLAPEYLFLRSGQ